MVVPRGLVERIRGEFLEMPGLKLTIEQARRLWNLDESICREALNRLIAEGFLHQTPSGGFIALPSASRMLKASMAAPAAQRSYRCPHCQHLNAVPIEVRPRNARAGTTFRCAACAKIVSIPEAATR